VSPSHSASDFRAEIKRRLEEREADIAQRRDEMNQVMGQLEKREATFNQIAEKLRDEVVYPTLTTLGELFDNAHVEDVTQGRGVRCQLRRSIRFPAVAHVEFEIEHDEPIVLLRIRYNAQILPAYIRIERDDSMEQSLDGVDANTIRRWCEQKLLGFLDAYLQIETHRQYQRENVAVDPVCGMTVAMPEGLSYEYDGKRYYFCAQRCLDRFIESPDDYVHVGRN